MGVFDNIKNKLGKRKINRILSTQKRKIRVTNFAHAKSIGIVYPVTTTDYQDVVNKYIDYLRGEIGFKKIISLGYCESKELPTFILNPSLKYQFFTKKELDLYNQGKSKEVVDFISTDFDILVDLSRDFIVPIKHIVASSGSKLKIGRHSAENEKFFDVMIEIGHTAPASKFIEQVNKFLTQVNPY